MELNFKQKILLNLKNSIGWKTKRKILVISVDDYGNVRLDSKKARETLDKSGLKVHSRFDAFDTLETKQDLEMLFEVLYSVKDKNGNSAVFTPFAIPCNINFEAMADSGYDRYIYELLPKTYEKLAAKDQAAYSGAWQLWQQGIKEGLMAPQFHGREHFNVRVFEEKLRNRDPELLAVLKSRSYTSISSTGYKTMSPTAAFDFFKYEENFQFEEIIADGLDAFEKVFNYRSVHFNPPGGREHSVIHKYLLNAGVHFLDSAVFRYEHQGLGKYRLKLNYTGRQNAFRQTFLVRNVVFEPTNKQGFDSVNYALKQVEAAFNWHRPAILSSHRVNFCGYIDPENRQIGLNSLKLLLKKITDKWPDIEFMSSEQLCKIINKNVWENH